MDLALYAKVLWRFRLLVVAGFGIGLVVAITSLGTPTLEGYRPALRYHAPTVWKSEGKLLVTQPGFPWGRSAFTLQDAERFGDETRFTSLAAFYAELATSDAVRSLVEQSTDANGSFEVQAAKVEGNPTAGLPILTVTGTSTSPAAAEELALAASRALQEYLEQEQDAAEIPRAKRVEIALVRRPSGAAIADKPSPVRPIFLFMLITIATVALAFVLENLRPQHRPALVVASDPPQQEPRRAQAER